MAAAPSPGSTGRSLPTQAAEVEESSEQQGEGEGGVNGAGPRGRSRAGADPQGDVAGEVPAGVSGF